MSRRWGWWAIAFVLGCETSSAISGSDGGTDASTDAGDASTGGGAIGSACLPSLEERLTFDGFSYQDVTLDETNPACGSAVCLVDHFQGRVSCPYGQTGTGQGPFDAGNCVAPDEPTENVVGIVNPQCTDRSAEQAVFCSCRCANADGKTDDGASYCTCPSDMTCTPVVPAFTSGDTKSGSYCTVDKSAFDRSSACANVCDPTMKNCSAPSVNVLGNDADGGATTYFLSGLRTQPVGLCLPQPLPNGGSPANCQVFAFLFATGDTCANHAGMTDVAPEVAASVRASASGITGTPPVCQLAQLPQPCSGSASAGWCYLTGANAAPTCTQNIGFSATGQPETDGGVSVALACP